jgi:hypothetical protein
VIRGQTVRFSDHFLGRGDWKLHLEKLERSSVYLEIADLLVSGPAFRDTPAYAELRGRMAEGRPAHRNLLPLDTVEKLDLYFEEVLELVRSIRDEGYRRRSPYAGVDSIADAALRASSIRPVLIELTESEIGVAVGPQGSLHRLGPGTHRFAIARQLGLKRVAVELRLFHIQWIRQAMAQSGLGPLRAIIAGAQDIRTDHARDPGR